MTRSSRTRRPTIFDFLLGPARKLAELLLTMWSSPGVANAVQLGIATIARASTIGALDLTTDQRNFPIGNLPSNWKHRMPKAI